VFGFFAFPCSNNNIMINCVWLFVRGRWDKKELFVERREISYGAVAGIPRSCADVVE
jgi:hypothetical protein